MVNLDYLTVERPADDDEYLSPGTRTLKNGNVEVRLPIQDAVHSELVGSIVPFELPPDAAIKFAAILLKRAGCTVSFGGGRLMAKHKNVRMN